MTKIGPIANLIVRQNTTEFVCIQRNLSIFPRRILIKSTVYLTSILEFMTIIYMFTNKNKNNNVNWTWTKNCCVIGDKKKVEERKKEMK